MSHQQGSYVAILLTLNFQVGGAVVLILFEEDTMLDFENFIN